MVDSAAGAARRPRRATQDAVGRALALVIIAGAALRFATLDVQSLWYDEAISARLLRMGLFGMLEAIPGSESSPPLYYVLAWVWTHVFGTGEVGLRSLSALLGSATIPFAWALGRRLGGDRSGLAAAALIAFNPMLVWFSQETRAYALLVLLAVVGTLLWLRALQSPGEVRRLLAWGAVAALALATHYYALFVVAPQGLWLLVRAPGWRARIAALAVPSGAAAALAPLAFAQRANDSAAFITDTPLSTRLAQVPKQFLVGYDAPAEKLLTLLMATTALVGIGGLVALAAGRIVLPTPARTDAARLAGATAATIALLLAASIAGEDHLLTRNVLAVLPLAAVLAGAGLAAVSQVAPRPALAAGIAACALGIVAIAGVALDPRMRRDDWRGAVAALGDAPGGHVIVAPASGEYPLRYYIAGARRLPVGSTPPPTAAIDYISLAERRPGRLPTEPAPPQVPVIPAGFELAGRTDDDTFTVVRLRAPAPVAVTAADVARNLDGAGPALLVTPPLG